MMGMTSPLLLARETSSIQRSQKCSLKMGTDMTTSSPITSSKIQLSTKPYNTVVKNSGSRFRCQTELGSNPCFTNLPAMWLGANYVNALTSASSSGKCKTHNSTCPLGLLWGQITNPCEVHSTVPDTTCHYHDCSMIPAQQWSQHYSGLYEYYVFSIICSLWEQTPWHGRVLCTLRFPFFFSYVFSQFSYPKMIPTKLLFLYLGGI